jgi:hypothetical protein
MTTLDLLNALADLCDALGAFRDRIDHRGIIPPNIVAAGDAVSVALGLDADTTWQETATALRTHATLTPELPEGWAWETGTTMTHAISRKPREPGGVRSDGCNIWINGSPGVDAEAVRAVLARAGVAP